MTQPNQPGTQVPDQRIDQMMEEFRRMREENKQLRQTVDYMTQQRAPQPTTEKKQLFQPQIESALEEFIKEKLAPITQNIENTQRYFADRDDLLMFNTRYSPKEYEKHKEKIETIRAERARMGQPLTREDAYKFILVEEYGKKPVLQETTQAPQAPVWDPYLNRFVDAGQATKPGAAAAQTPAPVTAAPVQQTNQTPAKQDDFVLPPVGMNPSTKAQPTFSSSRVENGADEKALEDWAAKYGDEAI